VRRFVASIGSMTNHAEAKWRSLIEAQVRSGLSVREFASARGLAPSTLYWWRSRLRREPAVLVPADVVETDVVTDPHRRPTFELQLGDSMTLRIPSGFGASELRRLIQAMKC
jgi:transposase-like protein